MSQSAGIHDIANITFGGINSIVCQAMFGLSFKHLLILNCMCPPKKLAAEGLGWTAF
jgi:hypothetical protein